MKFLILFVSLFFSLSTIAQLQEGTIANSFSHFQLKYKKDTIDFVIADTSLLETKPVLLFCQGSLPVPLFFDLEEHGVVSSALSSFNLREIKKNYHVVVISMPKTPIIAGPDHLNRSYQYVQDTAVEYSFRPEYREANFYENYVNRANKVIKYLVKQKWVDKTNIVVAGHSQGSRVAVGIAHSNKHVTKIGLFGYSPKRRIDQIVWTYRRQAQNGEISWEEADSLQQRQYDFHKLILNPDSVKVNPELREWKSFSVCRISELVGLEVPVYIAFGSEDLVTEYCDLLPLDFAEKNKTNYVLKRYPDLDHSFFPVMEGGMPNYENGQWNNVMMTFIRWSLE